VEFTWEQQGSSTFENAYKTRLAAGAEGMDIFTPARADYPVLASAGQLLDITGETYLDNYTDGVISSAEIDGKVYGIPITANCYIVWYNKDAFEQCGLTQPTTFDELEADCAVLKENGIVPLVAYPKSGAEQLAAFFFHDLLSKNPQWLDQLKTGEAKWTDEEAVAALAKLEEWVDNGYILDGSLSLDDTQAYQAFYQGQAAMLHNGTWSIDKIAEAEPEFSYGVFPYLAKEGTTNRAQYCPGNIWTIAAESSDVEAAKAVFNWISQPENAQLYCRTAKQFGTVKGISFDFHEAAEDITPFYEMDKTKMMHAYLTPYAKSELATQVQRLIAKDETQTTAEKAALALQIAQDNDNKN
jgi:raffinose/stachyose/melibiose transport system substrate-binding protein